MQPRITVENLGDACVKSFTQNTALRNRFKQSNEAEQREILTSWYEGVRLAPGIYGTASKPDELPSVDQFVEHTLPATKKAAA